MQAFIIEILTPSTDRWARVHVQPMQVWGRSAEAALAYARQHFVRDGQSARLARR